MDFSFLYVILVLIEAKNMEFTNRDLEKSGIVKYKAEKVINGKVVDTFEESYYKMIAPKFSHWKYKNALDNFLKDSIYTIYEEIKKII